MEPAKIIFVFIWLTVFSINKIKGQDNAAADEIVKTADNYKSRSIPDSAIFFYEKASVEFKAFGNIEKFINTYNHIGVILTRQDKYEKAKFYLEQALSTGLASLDSNDLLIAKIYISLGVVYGAEERFERSLFCHNKALAIRLLRSGKFDADVATSYGNLGNVYLRKKDYDRSIDAHLKAKRIREKIFGMNSVEVVQSYTNLGNAYKEKKKYKKSLYYYEKALENKIAQLGQLHKDLTRYYRNVYEVYNLMGDKLKGDEYKIKGEEIEKQSK